ncbi:tetratricopeptide repeat protein 16 [Talpa occidentalis]|uniref:tetratricopeptide repeat protein 16 n=1 Tax=Talpa occidentalis TaxID=50954 RepID=UPI00188E273E|nr:tetratricopeptide repeat protein 16 [Talpa occidentalis]
MTDSGEDSLELEQAPSHHIKKPWVIPAPERNLECIFGTSKLFQNLDTIKPKITGLTVPLKVREYYHRGQQCLEQSDWEMAVLFFSRALQLDSRLIDFYALRAEAYIQLCDFSSAAQNLRRAHSFQPENTAYLERLTWVLYLQGQCLFEQCAFMDALSVFSQASELQPEKACFRYRCMACLLALNRHQECLVLVHKEVKSSANNADIYILRARLYNYFEKPSLCYRDLHKALLLDPTHPKAKALLRKMVDQAQEARQEAGILAVQGKLRYALKRINCAIENNPLDPSFFLFRGTIYRQLGEFDTAVEDFLKALDMAGDSEGDTVQQAQRQLLLAYNDFAVHCYRQGAYQESVLLLNKAIKDEQQEKGLFINRGDCFFQMGNLAFAEADYKQALALSPQDEGANLRMGLLQEKRAFCEQRSRKFDKAEYHFSMAIQHNPQKPQYYLYRAKVRHLLQNILGARQDVVTVLLLDPKHPKLPSMLMSLFPGMSMKEVLSSQVAHLARLQLDRVMENFLTTDVAQGIVGQLRERELERQKARSLWQQEEPSQETSEELEATDKNLQTESEHPKEETPASEEEEEEKPTPGPSKVMSLTDSYQTSSGSSLACRAVSISETETSTICQEYRSSSATIVTFSDSSLLRSGSSDLGNWEDQYLIDSPRKSKATQDQSQSPSKIETSQDQSRSPSKTETSQGQSRSPSKTETSQGQSRSPSKSEVTQGPSPSKMEATQGESPSKMEATEGRSPSKMEASQGRSPSKTQVAQGRRSPSKTQAAQSRRSPSKTQVAQGQSPSKTQVAQGRSPSKTQVAQGQSPSKTEAAQGRSPSKTQVAQGQSPSKTEAAQGRSPSKTEAAEGRSPSKTQVAQGRRPSQTHAAQGRSPSKTEATQGQSPSKTEAVQGQSPSQTHAAQGQSPSQTEAAQGQSPSQTQAIQGKIRRLHKTKGTQCSRKRFRKVKVARTRGSGWGLIRSSSKVFYDSSQSPSNTELAQGQCQIPSKTTDAQTQTQSSSPDSSNSEVTQDLSQNPSSVQANQDSSLSS